jgi:hypothetical protein
MSSPTPTLDLFASDKRPAIVTKAFELIETQAIVTGSRSGIFLIVSSDGTNTYMVDTDERSCTCKGYLNFGRCYHLVAAEMLVDLDRKADVSWIPSRRG